MARIRSIHPGLFTDESFIELSDAAKIFWIGLWCESDDQGIFEWKPKTLKIKLCGYSNNPVEPLFEELLALSCIAKFEHQGKFFGAVRNFCKYQRPKKPNAVYPVPNRLRTFVGLSEEIQGISPVISEPDQEKDENNDDGFPTNSPPVPHQLRNCSADGGGRREKEEVTPIGSPVAADAPPPPPKIDPDPDLAKAASRWNDLADHSHLTRISKLTEPRRRALKLRVSELGGLEAWDDFLARISRSPLLTGKVGRGWKADFDWVLKPANFTRITEGKYDPEMAGEHLPGNQYRDKSGVINSGAAI